MKTLHQVVGLHIGEHADVQLSNGHTVTLQLHDVFEAHDTLVSAVRSAGIVVSVDGQKMTLHSGNYHLPVTVGKVQIDCPIVRSYYTNTSHDDWHLQKDARVRLWPAGSTFLTPGTFRYPVRQRWFASDTQMSNEPTFANGGEYPRTKIYYHDALDFGGAEGLDEVVAAADALVLSSGMKRITGYEDYPTFLKDGVIYMLDDRGWVISYNHLYSIDPAVQPGVRVRQGQVVGKMGKAGYSGGWTHLHMKIRSRLPSGQWAVEEAYPFVWEAYHRQYHPKVIAVARPHQLARAGETVTLDGRKSWNADSYEWTLSNGTTATGPVHQITYDRTGTYSEVLKVTDGRGHIDYDFAVVQVVDTKLDSARRVPAIHAAFHPTMNIRAGDPITFLVRSFDVNEYGKETWDFGDGSPTVTVLSRKGKGNHPDGYAAAKHQFSNPGHYIVSASRADRSKDTATAQLHVVVE